MINEEINSNDQTGDDIFNSLLSPLWSNYYKRVRKSVRFPRNYKEVNALGCQDCSDNGSSVDDNH